MRYVSRADSGDKHQMQVIPSLLAASRPLSDCLPSQAANTFFLGVTWEIKKIRAALFICTLSLNNPFIHKSL